MVKKPEKMVPDVRFKGFTDDWEQRKFKDSVTRISNQDNDSQLPHIEFENINSGQGTLKKGMDELKSNKSGIKFQKKDILFGKLRPYLKNWYLALNPGIAVGDFWVLRPNKSALFTYYLIQTNRFYSISNLTSGSKMPRSDWSLVSNYQFMVPQSMTEENKIGRMVSLLDKIIDLQQRKLEQLQQLKKAMLQQLFAIQQKAQPIARFEGFNGDWEQRKLGEVSNIVGGGTPNTKNKSYWGGKINWFTPAELGDFTYADHSQRTITELGLKNSSAKLLPKGTVLFTSRAGIGKMAILTVSSTTNQGFQSIIPNGNELNSYFVYCLGNKLKHYGETHGAGSTFVEVSGKELAKAKIALPSLQEQKNISNLMQRIQKGITLQQDALHQLNSLKKFFLQKLFI